jgi:hypothetical protein
MNLRACALLVGFMAFTHSLEATPRTWMSPHVSVQGTISAGRLGEEVACSAPVLGVRRRSVVAIAAPYQNGGRGAVHLYDPAAISEPFQILVPPVNEASSGFGSVLGFVDDVNGDQIEDLIVAAPGASSQTGGVLYAFISTLDGEMLRYVQCGSLSGAYGFGERIQAIRVAGGASDVHFVVGVPAESRIVGYRLTIENQGICSITEGNSFVVSGDAATRFGDSLAQVKGALSDGAYLARLAVSASQVGTEGEVSVFEAVGGALSPTSLMAGESQQPSRGVSGASIGARYNSELFVVGNPNEASGRGQVAVYAVSDLTAGPRCTQSKPLSESSSAFGRVVSHLGESFAGLVGAGRIAVAATQSEQATGGAVGLFGVDKAVCSDLFEINNCESDPFQEQGSAVVGGQECQTEQGGAIRHLIIVGAPGWSGGQGRVDLYLEGSEGAVPAECQAVLAEGAVPTATPGVGDLKSVQPTIEPDVTLAVSIVTVSPAESPDYSATGLPSDPVTITPSVSPTATSPVEITPSQSPTAMPTSQQTVTGDTSDEPPLWYSPTPTGAKTPDAGGTSEQIQDGAPIQVFPGASGLPTPEVEQRADQVVVKMPVVQPVLLAASKKRAVTTLVKKRRVSKRLAHTMVADPANLAVTYIVSYVQVFSQARFTLIQSAHADDGKKKRSTKIRRIRSRSNQVTLARLQPGATYRVSYQIEISLKKQRLVLGVTEASAPSTFVYAGS